MTEYGYEDPRSIFTDIAQKNKRTPKEILADIQKKRTEEP